MTTWGQINNCECGCSKRGELNATFLVKEDEIVCSNCGRSRRCNPPIVDVIYAECGCCKKGEKTTFVVDSNGTYIRTNCNRRR